MRSAACCLLLLACGGADADAPRANAAPSPEPAPIESASATPAAREAIQRIVRENFPAVDRCYKDGLSMYPSLAGMIFVRFLVDVTGTVVSYVPTDEATLPDPAVVTCVNDVFGKLVFPRAQTNTIVIGYPINLSPP